MDAEVYLRELSSMSHISNRNPDAAVLSLQSCLTLGGWYEPVSPCRRLLGSTPGLFVWFSRMRSSARSFLTNVRTSLPILEASCRESRQRTAVMERSEYRPLHICQTSLPVSFVSKREPDLVSNKRSSSPSRSMTDSDFDGKSACSSNVLILYGARDR